MSKRKPGQKKPLVTNAADRKQVKQAEKVVRSNQEYYMDSLKNVMATKDGRRVLWDFLSKCGIYAEIWEPSAKIHFNAGKRSVGLKVLGDITECDEDLFLIMQKENREREREINNVRSE